MTLLSAIIKIVALLLLPLVTVSPLLVSGFVTTTRGHHHPHHSSQQRQHRRSSTVFSQNVNVHNTNKNATYDPQYYTPPVEPLVRRQSRDDPTRITLTRFLSNYMKDHPELADLENILLAVQMACKTISNLVNRAGLVYSIIHNDEDDDESGGGTDRTNQSNSKSSSSSTFSDGRYYSMKRLDRLSTAVLQNALRFTGTVQMIVPSKAAHAGEQPGQHQPGVLIAYDEHNLACMDPLDGSGNADASICTGTVFGVFERTNKNPHSTKKSDSSDKEADEDEEASLLDDILQPAKNMRAAGYCLYSSATVLVFTLKDGVYGFTLDPQIREFVLTHDNLTIPPRGNVYSCNEANSEGWGEEKGDDDNDVENSSRTTSKSGSGGWKAYLKKLKLGQGQTQTRYAHRYVGSMVGDIHRTLLYGGIFAYPSDRLHKPQGNLQLLYKSAPMAFVVHHAGGKALDESGRDLLDKRPERIHQKSPCFMGSPHDVEELQGYL